MGFILTSRKQSIKRLYFTMKSITDQELIRVVEETASFDRSSNRQSCRVYGKEKKETSTICEYVIRQGACHNLGSPMQSMVFLLQNRKNLSIHCIILCLHYLTIYLLPTCEGKEDSSKANRRVSGFTS